MDMNAAIQSLLGNKQGQRVKGLGNGLSDSVPAVIQGQDGTQKPAALADGEYVIPADVVSMLGDGSTDAGFKVLDKLVEEVRMRKTGTSEQAGPL